MGLQGTAVSNIDFHVLNAYILLSREVMGLQNYGVIESRVMGDSRFRENT